jgi:hypothetical protein
VVVGEWGGFGRGRDMGFQRRLARYLRENDMPDNFYWCLNPNSGDTGGVLQDDWESPNWEKLRILHGINPEPSRIVEEADGSLRCAAVVCVVNSWGHGSSFSSTCASLLLRPALSYHIHTDRRQITPYPSPP